MSVSLPFPRKFRASDLPRIGFLGVGWIGRHRMQAMLDTGAATAAAICDPSPEMADEARKLAPDARLVPSFDALLQQDLDAIVIATPSALHAQQSIQALELGLAVFCQKPLGRTRQEVDAVIDAARRADRLLSVDLSYRFTAGLRHIRDLIGEGALGHVFAVDLAFHNAYGPDKPWFYDKTLSGGGCVMDLGIHLVDTALWMLDFPEVLTVESQLLHHGDPIAANSAEVEDFAAATIGLANGTVVRLTCSWGLNAGRDAVIRAAFYGTKAGAAMHNVGGSFYDFVAERYDGTRSQVLAQPPDPWGGRAAADWITRLAAGQGYDPGCERLRDASAVLDAIYGR